MLDSNNSLQLKERKTPLLVPIILSILGFGLLVFILGVVVNLLFFYVKEDQVYQLRGTSGSLYQLVPHVMSIIIITVFLIVLMIIINRKIKKADPLTKPKGLLLLVEILVTSIDNFTINMMGEKFKSFAPYIGYLAIYLFTANVFGLLGFTPPPTANLSVTLSFGLTTFLLVRYYGIKYNKWGHLTSLFKPLPLTPINIIGELATPFTLSIRLFGNILSGAIIMALVYTSIGLGFNGILMSLFNTNLAFGSVVAPSGIGEIFASFIGAPFLHIYFDLFSGFIQTFVFVLLTSVFISSAAN